jgi:nucleoside phosphorylase/cellobiose-specific phosphotransferase system component IIA
LIGKLPLATPAQVMQPGSLLSEDQEWKEYLIKDLAIPTVPSYPHGKCPHRNCDVLIFVANDNEWQMTLRFFHLKWSVTVKSNTYYYSELAPGRAPKVTAVICRQDGTGGTGQSRSILLMSEATRVWSPRLTIAAGCAFGYGKSHKLYDVIISSHIFGYEQAKITAEGFESRNLPIPVDHRVVSLFRSQTESSANWNLTKVDNEIDTTKCKAHLGGVLCGEKLLDVPGGKQKIVQDLKGDSKKGEISGVKIVGGEMEGIGALIGASQNYVPLIVVKGISDMADGMKNKPTVAASLPSSSSVTNGASGSKPAKRSAKTSGRVSDKTAVVASKKDEVDDDIAKDEETIDQAKELHKKLTQRRATYAAYDLISMVLRKAAADESWPPYWQAVDEGHVTARANSKIESFIEEDHPRYGAVFDIIAKYTEIEETKALKSKEKSERRAIESEVKKTDKYQKLQTSIDNARAVIKKAEEDQSDLIKAGLTEAKWTSVPAKQTTLAHALDPFIQDWPFSHNVMGFKMKSHTFAIVRKIKKGVVEWNGTTIQQFVSSEEYSRLKKACSQPPEVTKPRQYSCFL